VVKPTQPEPVVGRGGRRSLHLAINQFSSYIPGDRRWDFFFFGFAGVAEILPT
jgi:hypothetical protein